MISNTAVFLVVLPVLIVIFTLMDPLAALRAARTPELEALPVLPVAQALPTPVLLAQPADANSLIPQPIGPVHQAVQVHQPATSEAVAEHLDDPFFDEEVVDPLVEPPEDWDHLAEYQERMPTFDYSECDRYSIADTGKVFEEFVDEERGVYQTTADYEFEPQAT